MSFNKKITKSGKYDLYHGQKYLGTYTKDGVDKVIALYKRHEARKKLIDIKIKKLELGNENEL